MKLVRKGLVWLLTAMMALAMMAGPVALAEAATIVVNGNATVYCQPDQVEVMLGVQETSDTILRTQTTVNKKIAAVQQALLDFGVKREDISVGYLYIYTNYDYSGQTPKPVGYTAQHQLRVRISEIDKAGELIDVALKAGANQMDGLNFQLKDNTKAYQQALGLAIADAKEKAEVVAAAYGRKLGDLVSSEENMGVYGMEYGRYEREMDGAGSGDTQISAGDITVACTVSVKYALAD